ncbi:MAG: hypothetical protein M1833_005897 [Piccolia ochrophora]|nr:MAG: hypothetical protein M1833_005897 [Piccolia ochrophora]
MSLVQPSTMPARGQSPALNLSLASNNPFRNRAASPTSLQSEPSPQAAVFPKRPVSRNPFVDVTEDNKDLVGVTEPSRKMSASNQSSSRQRPLGDSAAELFDNLQLDDGPKVDGGRRPSEPTMPLRPENMPPRRPGRPMRPPPPGHRPSRSNEEEARKQNGAAPPEKLYRPVPPSTRLPEQRRIRRNSDSSVDIRASILAGPDEIRKHPERRHRDRRPRDGRPRVANESPKAKKPNHRLDIIDKLDVTSIYGTGLFHHDGPFDACNPHRNRKNSNRAPMQAFPKDSANNALGGSGPLNRDIDHAQYFGQRGNDAFADYSTSGADRDRGRLDRLEALAVRPPRPVVDRSQSFNATARVEPVHGDESLGLGTSTFLEGAPASRTAIKRWDTETEVDNLRGGGLGRKKSLAQRIRGINPSRQYSGRITSPEARYEHTTSGTTSPQKLDGPFSPSSGGGTKKLNDSNPFFNEYDAAYDKKGESIAVAEKDLGSPKAPSSPAKGLERRVTNDGNVAPEENKPSGFLSRVKSLKGGRRVRPSERPL